MQSYPGYALCAVVMLALNTGCVRRTTEKARVADWPERSPPALDTKRANGQPPPAPRTNTHIGEAVAPLAPRSPAGHSEDWVSLSRWCADNDLPPPRSLSADGSSALALTATPGVLVIHSRSHEAQWNGVEVRLGFLPRVINNELFVHRLDLMKTLWPLLSDRKVELPGSPIALVIDPGHGGHDTGAQSVGGPFSEKDLTLDWALRLARLLPTNYWRVWLTRTNDSELALSNRVAFAEQHHAALFVSLHFNSARPDAAQSGLETYCLTPTGMPSTITRDFSDESRMEFPNNKYDADNLILALGLHRAILKVTGHEDRGIRRARFPGVLRGQVRAAALLEGGYLSNPAEAEWISRPEHRQQLAEAVASGLDEVARFSNSSPITTSTLPPSSSIDTLRK